MESLFGIIMMTGAVVIAGISILAMLAGAGIISYATASCIFKKATGKHCLDN